MSNLSQFLGSGSSGGSIRPPQPHPVYNKYITYNLKHDPLLGTIDRTIKITPTGTGNNITILSTLSNVVDVVFSSSRISNIFYDEIDNKHYFITNVPGSLDTFNLNIIDVATLTINSTATQFSIPPSTFISETQINEYSVRISRNNPGIGNLVADFITLNPVRVILDTLGNVVTPATAITGPERLSSYVTSDGIGLSVFQSNSVRLLLRCVVLQNNNAYIKQIITRDAETFNSFNNNDTTTTGLNGRPRLISNDAVILSNNYSNQTGYSFSNKIFLRSDFDRWIFELVNFNSFI